jgi:membrane protein YqaA with SNARE-associated domain
MDAAGGLGHWAVVWALSVVLNVIPAFMPPTWALLSFFHLKYQLGILPLAVIGAFGSATGRTLLALGSRVCGRRVLSESKRKNIEQLGDRLQQRSGFSLSGLALFAIGPVPTNHLFIAAGMARVPLAPVVAVFAISRCVSYILWMKLTETAARSLRDVITPNFGNAVGVAAQVVGFVLLIVLLRIDWAKRLSRWLPDQPGSNSAA